MRYCSVSIRKGAEEEEGIDDAAANSHRSEDSAHGWARMRNERGKDGGRSRTQCDEMKIAAFRQVGQGFTQLLLVIWF